MLIVKPSAIGDVVHALPVLNLIRRRWPAAHVSWLVTPACAGLLDGHPQLDEVIRFDRRRFGHAWRSPSAAAALAAFHADLRRRQFDLVIDLQGLFRSGWLAWSTGAAARVGTTTDREFGWAFATHVAPVGGRDRHAVDRYLAVAEFLGLGAAPVEFVFPTDDADRAAVAPLLPAGPFAVLVPATNWPTKRGRPSGSRSWSARCGTGSGWRASSPAGPTAGGRRRRDQTWPGGRRCGSWWPCWSGRRWSSRPTRARCTSRPRWAGRW